MQMCVVFSPILLSNEQLLITIIWHNSATFCKQYLFERLYIINLFGYFQHFQACACISMCVCVGVPCACMDFGMYGVCNGELGAGIVAKRNPKLYQLILCCARANMNEIHLFTCFMGASFTSYNSLRLALHKQIQHLQCVSCGACQISDFALLFGTA